MSTPLRPAALSLVLITAGLSLAACSSGSTDSPASSTTTSDKETTTENAGDDTDETAGEDTDAMVGSWPEDLPRPDGCEPTDVGGAVTDGAASGICLFDGSIDDATDAIVAVFEADGVSIIAQTPGAVSGTTSDGKMISGAASDDPSGSTLVTIGLVG